MRTSFLECLVLAAAVAGVACGGTSVVTSDVPRTDTSVDVGADSSLTDTNPQTDSGTDVTVVDSGIDVVTIDVGTDVLVSPDETLLMADTGTDVATDTAPVDTGVDVVTDTGPTITPRAATQPTNGSGVAITADNSIAVAVNRTAGSISVFSTNFATSPPAVTRTTELTAPAGSQPWAAVMGNDGDTAYVIYRQSQQVVKITNLHAAPTIASTVAVTGSEPTGIAIAPSGTRLFVANWAEGTVTVVNTATMTVAGTVDLNGSLVGTGFLGPVTARPALAHPRAIVVTNGGTGNDSVETVYVTEFYSQARTTGVPTDDTQFDQNRQGVVYAFNAGTLAVGAPITIAPVASTGFADSDGNATGCFPNQLYAAALNNGNLYVTAVCASPRGPINVIAAAPANPSNVKTQVHAAVFVINTTTNLEVPTQRVVMTAAFNTLFAGATTARFPLIPNDIAFVPGATVAYIPAYGSDAVYRVHYLATGALSEVGSSVQQFINIAAAAPNSGGLPYGIAIDNTGNYSLVINETTRNLSVVQFSTQVVLETIASSALPTGTAANLANGHRLFVTGLLRWSLNGAAWNSCESCHPDGLTDNVTWFFGRGPRQTISLDGTFDAAGDQRILNWTAINDEVHDFENNTRGNSGGVGAVVAANSSPPVASDRIIFDGTTPVAPQVGTLTRNDGLNGSVALMMPGSAGVLPAIGTANVNSVVSSWNDITTYVQQIRSPRPPTGLVTADVNAGAILFAANCAGCHGSPLWTIGQRFYTPGEANNNLTTGNLITHSWARPAGFPAAVVPATSTFRLSPFNGNNDQITCVLRNVGTFANTPATTDGMGRPLGVAPSGVTVLEVRAGGGSAPPSATPIASMSVTAQGATGYNPPSMVGLVTGAPYFHAGNARTLEEAFSPTFAAHYQAFSVNFLDGTTASTQIGQLVAYLLSIDKNTAVVPLPSSSSLGFNPNVCASASPAFTFP